MDQDVSPALPPHVDPARVREYDMFNVPMQDGEYQLGAARFLGPDTPDIFWSPANGGHWVFTRTPDIERAMNDPELFSSAKMFVPREKNPTPPLIPLMTDAPDHAKYKALIAPAFTPRATAILGEQARALAIRLIEGFKPAGECEFVKQFAEVLPISVFMNMVGLPEADRDMLMEFGEQHVRPITPQHHIDSMRGLQAYARQKIAERRGGTGTDLITQLAAAEVDGKQVDDETLAGMIVLLLVAGLDTVAAELGFFARFLASSPAHRRQLAADPSLIPHAVEEMLRRYSIATVGRLVTRDAEFAGVQLKKDDMVIMPTIFLGMDAKVFANPETVDFARPNVLHGAFSLGPHRCVGSMLARTELRIFVEEWLKRIPDFAIKPGAEIRASSGTVSGLRSLPLVWEAA